MKVAITKTIELDVDELATAMSPVEMLTLFTEAANRIAEKGTANERRELAHDFSFAMSENAKRLLAEILAADYVRLSSVEKP